MAIQLSVKADALLKEISIKPQIILDIEGLDLIFGAQPILKTLEWDDENAFWDDGLLWDGTIEDAKSRDYINLTGTTTNISQQIAPDKGNTSSISTVNINIVDKNGEVSKAISFDSIDEILGRKAIFAIGFAQGRYPEDASPIFRGVVVDFYTDSGNVMISLASPETLKRQSLLDKHQTELSADINSSQTTIDVLDTSGFIEAADALSSYIRINDEIMRIVSIDSATQLTVERAQLNTVANPHNLEDEAESFYRLQGNPLDLARKLMLSNDGNTYFTSLDIPKSIEFISATESLDNAIIFDYYDIQEKTGLTIGDQIQLDSTLNSGTYTIDEFGTLENGDSYIIVNENLNLESDYTGSFLYRSKWNVLPVGLNMLTSEVDTAQFDSIASAFGSNFIDYDFYIKDTIDDCKEFIDKQLYQPQGLYPLPRKARTSVKFVVPPFSNEIISILNTDAITNINKIKQRRSAHRYLYNTYVYRYNEDSLEDKFLTGKVILNAQSVNRINLGKKQLKIESSGLRNTPAVSNIVDNIIQRYSDRYRFAPVYFDGIELKYKDGYKIEVGDIVPFGGSDTKLVNLSSGSRSSEPKLYEVVNKSLNVKNGNVKISLLESSFEIQARYGVFSLASEISNGSTAARIFIKRTNDTEEFARESDKWIPFAGQRVRIRSIDYTEDEESVLIGVDPSDSSALLLETPLSFIPNESHVIEIPFYDDSSSSIDSDYKLQFCYMTAQAVITNVIDSQTFEVDDIAKLAVGSKIYIHSKDYQRDSFEQDVEVDSINLNQVILSEPLDFLPLIGDLVDRSKFQDGGDPYLII